MTKIVRIDPDGRVTRLEGSVLLTVALDDMRALDLGGFQGEVEFPRPIGRRTIATTEPSLDLVTSQGHSMPSWVPHPGGICVLAVHEWGVLMRLPVNPKAWALYGRSPLVGPAYLAHDWHDPAGDARPDLDESFIESFTAWQVPEHLMMAMRSAAPASEYTWLP